MSARTLQRWSASPSDLRAGPAGGPANKLNDAERADVLRICKLPEYSDKSPAQIVPLLADKGVYLASESTFYRLLNEAKLLAHRGKSKRRSVGKVKKALEVDGPGQVWAWDITYLKTATPGVFLYLYMILDLYSRKIVGWHISEEQCGHQAQSMLRAAYLREGLRPGEVTLHSDNGGPMKSVGLLTLMQHLGVTPSYSRPSVSNDNAYAETAFKTLKYCPKYPGKPFAGKDEAEAWMQWFVAWYGGECLHSSLKFVTPNDRHKGLDKEILEKRKLVYEAARAKNPLRWSRETRNWKHESKIKLTGLTQRRGLCNNVAA